MHPRGVHVLCLLLLVPLWARAAPTEVEARLSVLEPVGVSEYHGGQGDGLRLTFKKLGPNPALALFSLEDARAVVEALELRASTGVVMAGFLAEPPSLPDLERRVRETYEALYGSARVALPDSLESARWLQALALSPREAVAERFGKAMGGVGLRVLVTVAGARLSRVLPEVPGGGLWARLSPPRFSFAGGGRGGLRVGDGARGQVSVADGTVVLMGVTANTTAAAVASAVTATRTTGACAESKKSDNQAHHLCTNKNDTSERNGGPWTPLFEELFERAGMSLDDPANIVYLRDHKGPHPEEYHREVLRRLREALESCGTRSECRASLVEELDKIAGDVCKTGSGLNKLATKKP